MDKAVRIFILLFVFVFDPLAIMLLIAANQTLIRYGINLESTGPEENSTSQSNNVKEVIKEVEIVKEVEKEIDMNAVKTPRAVKALEKKLKKKLDNDGTRS